MTKVSVIIRSMNRPQALLDLLDALCNQNFRPFEIVVVDQSASIPDFFKHGCSKLLPGVSAIKMYENGRTTLFEGSVDGIDIHFHRYPPLGGPGARNKGVELSTGEILVFIDDDDLPVGEDWLGKHVEIHTRRPELVGLSGRQVHKIHEKCPYLPFIQPMLPFFVMQYSFLKTPYTFARFDKSVEPVSWIHGTNASIKRTWVEKAGGWDTSVRNQDEHSFAFKLARLISANEKLRFDHTIVALRRTDIPGGMGKRLFSIRREIANQWAFFKRVIGRYYPVRFVLLFPVYLGMLLIKVIQKVVSSVRKPGAGL
jgi:glycosyltransferase involved in cell wall biosynthesis